MKKIVILLIVLGLVNVASAGVVDLVIKSLNGNPYPDSSEITVGPSDWVDFDLVYYLQPGEMQMYLFALSSDIYIDPASVGTGELSVTDPDTQEPVITFPAGLWDETITEVFLNDDGSIGISGFAKDLFVMPGSEEPMVVLDHFLFHCLGEGDVIISMVENPDHPAGLSFDIDDNGDPYDIVYGAGITIHQIIPEPMTIALLGLGGLLLRRRKK